MINHPNMEQIMIFIISKRSKTIHSRGFRGAGARTMGRNSAAKLSGSSLRPAWRVWKHMGKSWEIQGKMMRQI